MTALVSQLQCHSSVLGRQLCSTLLCGDSFSVIVLAGETVFKQMGTEIVLLWSREEWIYFYANEDSKSSQLYWSDWSYFDWSVKIQMGILHKGLAVWSVPFP